MDLLEFIVFVIWDILQTIIEVLGLIDAGIRALWRKCLWVLKQL